MRDSPKIYIDGEWIQPAGAETIEIINAATEKVVGKVSLASAGAVDLAVSAARKALRTFAGSSRRGLR
jgi:aldehyde dehydrogenase (NAD+)